MSDRDGIVPGETKLLMEAKRFSALIDSFYAASTQPDRWQEAAMQMASFLDSESAVIQVRTGGISTMALRATTANYDHAAQQAYVSHFYKRDPAVNGWHAIGRPGIFVGRELVDYAALQNSEFYVDHLRRIGVFYPLCAIQRLDADTTLMSGIHRPVQSKDFEPEDRRRLGLAAPHLLRAAWRCAPAVGCCGSCFVGSLNRPSHGCSCGAVQ